MFSENANTKTLISCMVTMQLISVFVSVTDKTYNPSPKSEVSSFHPSSLAVKSVLCRKSEYRFSHDAAHTVSVPAVGINTHNATFPEADVKIGDIVGW